MDCGILRVKRTAAFYLLVEKTVETEDEETLQGVESGEQVSQRQGLGVEEEIAQDPSQPQQNFKSSGTLDPRSGAKCNRGASGDNSLHL